MDSSLLKAGGSAHHAAIGSLKEGSMGASQGDFEKIIAAVGRMIASVPEEKTMAVYNDFGKLVDPAVPKYLMGSVKEADAQAAYKALLAFKDVVKANPIKPEAVTAKSYSGIDAAAGRLAEKSYNFLKEIDWTSNLAAKGSGFSGTPLELTRAVDKALAMGYAMDAGALKEAAQAHVKAINNMDAKGVATKADYEAILAGLGKAIATVPIDKVTNVYDFFSKTVD